MTKISAEDVAKLLEAFGRSRPMHSGMANEKAALVRALEAVRVAAIVVDDAAMRGLFAMSPPAVTYFTELQEALAAVERIERGET